MDFVKAHEFEPKDRHFYWWRNSEQGHCMIVLIRDGLVLFTGFWGKKNLIDTGGEFWPEPLTPPALPVVPNHSSSS